MDNITTYVKDFASAAAAAGKKYNLNPLFILAQGAIESQWGNSFSARNRKNFFGICSRNNKGIKFSPNEYWPGRDSQASTGIWFRIYPSAENSFLDFARLIIAKYPPAAKSATVEEYARAIAQSSYISEGNGDNRDLYEHNLIWAAKHIMPLYHA